MNHIPTKVKTDVMQPSCIEHHINIFPNAFVESLKIDAQILFNYT